MNVTHLRVQAVVYSALLFATVGLTRAALQQTFSEPALVKGSPTNLASFDVSWNDNAAQRYYFADRTNNAIDLVDSATDTFVGFIGKGHYTGANVCPGTRDARHCAGPNGVVTDNLGHVWAGDGEGNVIEADATRKGTTIIRSIPTGGKFRVDEMAYDPVDQILMVSDDGDSPPLLTFISVRDGTVLGHYRYPAGQDGMEQSVWDSETGLFYQNVPGDKNRIDVFDPHKLPNPIKSFPVQCSGGLIGLTVSGLTVGPKGRLMTVCGSIGGVSIDPTTGQVGKKIPEGADADEVWYDPGSTTTSHGPERIKVSRSSTRTQRCLLRISPFQATPSPPMLAPNMFSFPPRERAFSSLCRRGSPLHVLSEHYFVTAS
jgi:hypothetical protein